MNRLFEAYVAALVRRTLAPRGFKVLAQSPRSSLAHQFGEPGKRAFQTRPDLHVSRGDAVTVFDTKWKAIDTTAPNFGVEHDDAYQMLGYAHVYGADSAILVFPHHSKVGGEPGFRARWQFVGGERTLAAMTIDLNRPSHFTELLDLWSRSDGAEAVKA